MTQELEVLMFKESPVRIQRDNNGEPWWIAKDVCNILALRTNNLRQILDSDEIREINPNDYAVDIAKKTLWGEYFTSRGGTLVMVESGKGGKPLLIINEPGLYKLIIKSRKPEAKEFQRWVTHVVLPSIRKTGSYSVQSIQQKESSMLDMMETTIKILRVHDQRIEALEKKSTEQVLQLTVSVQPIGLREQINMAIRNYAKIHGSTKEDYRQYYNNLYTQFYYRYHIDLRARKRNAGDGCILDTAERLGVLPDLLAVAKLIFN